MDNCGKVRELLALRESGMLDYAGNARVSAHLAACPSCAGYARSIEAAVAAVRTLDRDAETIEPPADLHERLTAAIRMAAAKPARRFPVWKVGAVAAGIAIVAFSLYFAFFDRHPARVVHPVAISRDALPTLALYHRAASLDPHDLDMLLDGHAKFCPRDEPGNTAGRAPSGPSAGARDNSKEAYHEA